MNTIDCIGRIIWHFCAVYGVIELIAKVVTIIELKINEIKTKRYHKMIARDTHITLPGDNAKLTK